MQVEPHAYGTASEMIWRADAGRDTRERHCFEDDVEKRCRQRRKQKSVSDLDGDGSWRRWPHGFRRPVAAVRTSCGCAMKTVR